MKKILSQQKGQGLVEYALILVLVSIAVVAVLSMLGTSVNNVFAHVVDTLEQSAAEGPGDDPGQDCYGSLLLPYLVGSTALFSLMFQLSPLRRRTTTLA